MGVVAYRLFRETTETKILVDSPINLFLTKASEQGRKIDLKSYFRDEKVKSTMNNCLNLTEGEPENNLRQD